MLAILLAAGLAAHHGSGSASASAGPTTVDGRVSLLEARQMLESQQLWSIRAQLPPEALKAIGDIELHVQHDQEQEDRVRDLTATVQQLEQRLLALELALANEKSAADGSRIPVAPMQMQPIVVPSPAAKKKPVAKKAHKAPARARVASSP